MKPDSKGYTPGLLLYRKIGESFVVGTGDNEVLITIEEARGSRAGLRILSGKNIPILRSELQDQSFFKTKSSDEFGKY